MVDVEMPCILFPLITIYREGRNGDMSRMRPDDDATWADLFEMLNDKVGLFLLGRGMWHEYHNYWKKALTCGK